MGEPQDWGASKGCGPPERAGKPLEGLVGQPFFSGPSPPGVLPSASPAGAIGVVGAALLGTVTLAAWVFPAKSLRLFTEWIDLLLRENSTHVGWIDGWMDGQ